MPEEPLTPETTTAFDPSLEAPEPAYSDPAITWTASEYIAHHKSTKWYAMLGLVAVIIAALVWLMTKDTISALVVIVGAAVLGGYGSRPPRELTYQLDTNFLTIGDKNYDLDTFRSFTVDDQQAFASVNLMPLKRFAPALSIYFAPDDEAAIVDLLSLRLPLEQHHDDPIDRLMRKIRF
ncbi:MAG: hypothetical protein QFB87_00660 [Patescibacteria group bacterium]|nr:hypothetical protein [Patescibacteria group bacterium]